MMQSYKLSVAGISFFLFFTFACTATEPTKDSSILFQCIHNNLNITLLGLIDSDDNKQLKLKSNHDIIETSDWVPATGATIASTSFSRGFDTYIQFDNNACEYIFTDNLMGDTIDSHTKTQNIMVSCADRNQIIITCAGENDGVKSEAFDYLKNVEHEIDRIEDELDENAVNDNSNTLCKPGEEVIISCLVNTKQLSVCLTNNKKMQYRYGSNNKTDLELTATAKVKTINHPGGGEQQLWFENKNYDYVVYSYLKHGAWIDEKNGSREYLQGAGVYIHQDSVRIADKKCTAYPGKHFFNADSLFGSGNTDNRQEDSGQNIYGSLTYCKLNDKEQHIFERFKNAVKSADIVSLSDREINKIFDLIPADYYLFMKLFNHLEVVMPHSSPAITDPDAIRFNHNNQEECYAPDFGAEQVKKLDQIFARMMKISPNETLQKIFTILAGPFNTDLPDVFQNVLFYMTDYQDVLLRLDEDTIRGLLVQHNTSYIHASECEREYGLEKACPLELPVSPGDVELYKLFRSVASKMEQEFNAKH